MNLIKRFLCALTFVPFPQMSVYDLLRRRFLQDEEEVGADEHVDRPHRGVLDGAHHLAAQEAAWLLELLVAVTEPETHVRGLWVRPSSLCSPEADDRLPPLFLHFLFLWLEIHVLLTGSLFYSNKKYKYR